MCIERIVIGILLFLWLRSCIIAYLTKQSMTHHANFPEGVLADEKRLILGDMKSLHVFPVGAEGSPVMTSEFTPAGLWRLFLLNFKIVVQTVTPSETPNP